MRTKLLIASLGVVLVVAAPAQDPPVDEPDQAPTEGVFDETGVPEEGSIPTPLGELGSVEPLASACPLKYFPVRGKHSKSDTSCLTDV